MANEGTADQTVRVNPGYARFQIAKALRTNAEHSDPATRERAIQKIARWQTVLEGMATGALGIGSRTPVEGVPAWATLEVVTGGFATGNLLADGPLQDHERRLLDELGAAVTQPEARRLLNAFYLSDAGIARLHEMLGTGCFEVSVPEEGALLAVAWLAQNEHADLACELLETIALFLDRLRFYPIQTNGPRTFGSRVFLQDVQTTRSRLAAIRPNRKLLAQREAVEVWTPLYDRLVSLFLETVQGDLPTLQRTEAGRVVGGGWPCQVYPEGWRERVQTWLSEFDRSRASHRTTRGPEKKRKAFAQLQSFAKCCVGDPRSLTGREVGRIRLILAGYLAKNGQPSSAALRERRAKHVAESRRPLFSEIAPVLEERLATFQKDEGLADPSAVTFPVTAEEELRCHARAGTIVPDSLRRKVERCLCDTVEVLVERGLITSGEVLARLLPQITAGQRASGFSDPALRSLYSAVYRAFRRRRSLLLLDLQSQVRLEELPWIAAIEQFRIKSPTDKQSARSALEEVASFTISSFPQAILPNKLLQELRALVKGAELDIPLVDELAADIFMGQFSGKFVQAAKIAAELLDGTLYARYFDVDFELVRKMSEAPKKQSVWRWFSSTVPVDEFAKFCAARAGVPLGTWRPATNGMIIEQQQILTTQNLAALFGGLDLTQALKPRVFDFACTCYAWVIRRLQVRATKPHARLIAIKNSAYAWRQMIFYLALANAGEVESFLAWADERFLQQPDEFRTRFMAIQSGLKVAAGGAFLNDAIATQMGVRRFLGWSNDRHWLC